ncbi:MAG: DUF4433 domain-containing protein [Candidatus Hydrogenedentes bacterium]|nr:DUF4433 domain-containing protein [Candidatus Hydrogenedentota bacterium]
MIEARGLLELHYITPMENVASILQRGILSHVRSAKVEHVDIAMEEIQAKRSDRQIPGGRRLHGWLLLWRNWSFRMRGVHWHD